MTIKELFQQIGVENFDHVQWGKSFHCLSQGIYIVSTSVSLSLNSKAMSEPRFDESALRKWINRLSEFTVDGVKPTVETLKKRLAEFWLPEENILYIGQTESSLSKRIGDYYRTELGARTPHSGGQWLKTLANINSLHVYYAPVQNPKYREDELLAYFLERTGALPFANLKGPGRRKQHGLKGQRDLKRKLI